MYGRSCGLVLLVLNKTLDVGEKGIDIVEVRDIELSGLWRKTTYFGCAEKGRAKRFLGVRFFKTYGAPVIGSKTY